MAFRAYQNDQFLSLRQGVAEGCYAQMLMSPPGSGKTEVAKRIIKNALAKGRRVWFLVDSLNLLNQTWNRCHKDGIDAGIVQSDHPSTNYGKLFQIVMVQSLRTRLKALLATCPPDLVLIDEAHILCGTHLELISWGKANKVPSIGLSGTPWAKGLGLIFDQLVSCITVSELIEQGYLVPAQYWTPFVPFLKDVGTQEDGDWIEDELAELMGEAKVVGDTVDQWLKLGENRKTLVFACNIRHAKKLAEAFFNAGIMAAHIDGYMPADESETNLRLHRQGKIKVLISVGMLIKGYDDPTVSCLVLAAPTKSLMRHYQMLGRGGRPSPETGKTDFIVIDQSGNILRNGRFEDAVPEQLDKGGTTQRLDQRPSRAVDTDESKENPKTKTCSFCSATFTRGLTCPKCGQDLLLPDGVLVAEGRLVRLDDRRKVLAPSSKRRVFEELLGHAQNTGKKQGWAYYAYQAFLKEVPDRSWIDLEPCSPSPEVSRWIKGYNIRRAKSSHMGGH